MSLYRCKWCGREYEYDKSTARHKFEYCCNKCESEAVKTEREEIKVRVEEAEKESEQKAIGCGVNIIKWAIIIIVILFVVGMCAGNDDGEEQSEETAQCTMEQVIDINALQTPTA